MTTDINLGVTGLVQDLGPGDYREGRQSEESIS